MTESKRNTWCKKCGYRIWGWWIKDAKKLPEDTEYCEECLNKQDDL